MANKESFYEGLEDRKKKEIEHSDRRRQIVTGYEYLTDTSASDEKRDYVTSEEEYDYHFSNTKFYSITKTSFGYRDRVLYEDIQDKITLDYCCGNGEIGIAMAQSGAKEVHGIDISEVSVKNASALAVDHKVKDTCDFAQMDAEKMTYSDDYFDIVHEYGALHHVDLEASLAEVSRVLKPNGKFICTEALRHNPFIHWYRKRSMHLRTVWEVDHILGVPDIYKGKKYFNTVKVRYFHLFALGAIPFRKTFIFKPLLKALELLDEVVLRIPIIQKWAWVAVIEYSNPK
ncbi:class I SAM-dependent methyltransferase [bacterium]|jgi:ubiquinone/menaquinone biosynthesis C-methylase UbiE|nr:class I SAM-dependent methyltransferase [bacterium]